VVLTNALSDGGLRGALRERVLKQAFGLAVRAPQPMSPAPASLAEYEGTWRGPFELWTVRATAAPGEIDLQPSAHPPRAGSWTPPAPPPSRWVFYAPDRMVAVAPEEMRGARAEFVRDAEGRLGWLRCGGRIGPRAA
jgi:hypothetical protein